MIDFKLPVVIEHENGTTEYHVRVYQGALTTEDEGAGLVTGGLGGRLYQSDFRTGGKWGNVVRTRWPWVRQALEWHNERLLVPRPLWVPAGAESLTVRPDPSPEVTSVDGRTNHTQANQTWATIRGGAGTGASDTEANKLFILISCGAGSGQG